MSVHVNVCHGAHTEVRRQNLWADPTTWVPGNELSLSDLAADSFTYWAILPPFNSTFYVTAQPLNVRMNLYQLCGSSTAGYIVCRGVYKIASTRFLICRDLLILQQLLTRLGDAVSTTCGKTCKLTNPGELETCLYSVLSILGAAFQGFYRHQVTRLWREAYRKKKKKSQKEKEWNWLAVQYICLFWLLLFSEVLCQLLPSLHSTLPLLSSGPTLLTAFLFQVILGAGQLFQAQQDLLHRTAPLLLSYYLIKWASQCLATDVPVDTLWVSLSFISFYFRIKTCLK